MHLSNSPFKSWWISRQMERITFWNPCQNISIEFVIRPIFDHPHIDRKFLKYHLFYIFATHNCNTAHCINHNAIHCIIIHCTMLPQCNAIVHWLFKMATTAPTPHNSLQSLSKSFPKDSFIRYFHIWCWVHLWQTWNQFLSKRQCNTLSVHIVLSNPTNSPIYMPPIL